MTTDEWMGRVRDLEALVNLLKHDAADGTSNQHFKDGAEAALRWAWTHHPQAEFPTDGDRELFITDGLLALGGEEVKS